MKSNIKPFSTRTFQKEGKWVERPHKTEVLTCTCGYKYIATRANQITCIKCSAPLKIVKK